MKKIIILAILAMMVVGVSAQDTIHQRSLKSNYYYERWIDTTINLCYETGWGGFLGGDLRGKGFAPKDSIKIAGIAYALNTLEHDPHWDTNDWQTRNTLAQVMDTSLDNAFEYLSIYQKDTTTGEMTQVSDALCVHIRDTVPAYIMDLGMYLNDSYLYRIKPFPVFELFFDEPITIADTFFILMTKQSYKENITDSTGRRWLYSSMPIFIGCYCNDSASTHGDTILTHSATHGWFQHSSEFGLQFLFPILYTAPPDSIAPPDTVGIVTPQMLDSMVEVMPNPATDHIQVTSKVGLKKLEIYNSTGTLVLTLSTSGTSAQVDIKSLPAGNYIMKVHTSLGITNKKLIFTR